MKRFSVFIISAFFLTFLSCDNMERDLLLNGTEIPDNGETQDNEALDDNETPDMEETVDYYEEPDNTDTVPDDINDENPVCGNSIKETGESCDSDSTSCSGILGDNYEGTANCLSDCSGYDTSTCTEVQQNTVVYEVDKARCNGCRRCLWSCSEGALSMSGADAVIDPEKCTGCGDCAGACPRGAIKKKTD
jgi:ferredoxin